MALYSMIQFTSVTLLYQVPSNLSDWEYLYIDLLIIIPLAATMGLTKSYKTLSPYQPGSNLVSFPVLLSVIGQTIIVIAVQATIYYNLTAQSWFVSGTDLHLLIGDADEVI
jgi:cation-transporting ATPase 13A3/4/5